MGFVGPVSELSGRWIRPHDVEILREPESGASEAMIDRIAHLGFEVRVELTLGDGERTWVQTTRGRAQELELGEGEIVWLRPVRAARRSATRPGVRRLGQSPDRVGQAPARPRRRASVSSTTARMLARSAIQTVCRFSAAPG